MTDEEGIYSYCVLPPGPVNTRPPCPPRNEELSSHKQSSNFKSKLLKLYRHAQLNRSARGNNISRSRSAEPMRRGGDIEVTTWTFHKCSDTSTSDVYEVPVEPDSCVSVSSTSSGCSTGSTASHLATTEEEIDNLLHGYSARPPTARRVSEPNPHSSKSLPRSARKSCLKNSPAARSSAVHKPQPPRKTVSIQELTANVLRDSVSQPELSELTSCQQPQSNVLVTRAIVCSTSTSSEDCGFVDTDDHEEDTTSTLYERIDGSTLSAGTTTPQLAPRTHRTFSTESSSSSSSSYCTGACPRGSWTSTSSADSTEMQALSRLFQCMAAQQNSEHNSLLHKK